MSSWNADTWIAVAALILSVLAIAGSGLSYFFKNTSEDEANSAVDKLETEKINPLKKTVIDHDRRIIRIEKDIEALPQVGEVRTLNDKISDLGGKMEAMTTEVRYLHEGQIRTEKQLQIITENLMERGA